MCITRAVFKAASQILTLHTYVVTRCERGETAVEYVLMVSMSMFSLIALVGSTNLPDSLSSVPVAISHANSGAFSGHTYDGLNGNDSDSFPGMADGGASPNDGGGTKGFFTEAQPIDDQSPASGEDVQNGEEVSVD